MASNRDSGNGRKCLFPGAWLVRGERDGSGCNDVNDVLQVGGNVGKEGEPDGGGGGGSGGEPLASPSSSKG